MIKEDDIVTVSSFSEPRKIEGSEETQTLADNEENINK
jgi:hypothetical protein